MTASAWSEKSYSGGVSGGNTRSPTELRECYRRYARPGVGKVLSALGLARVYHRAQGDRLYSREPDGTEVAVLDFLGGYGASLFGHHHPALVEAVRTTLESGAPFNAQASCRSEAALLAEQLDRMMLERTGGHFVSILLSTGTEAVEAALKHAALVRRRRFDDIERELDRRCAVLRGAWRKGTLRLGEGFGARARALLPVGSDPSLEDVLAALRAHVVHRLEAAPAFVAVERSFHGKTTGSMQLTHRSEYRDPFGRLGPEVHFVSADDPSELEAVLEQSVLEHLWPEFDAEGRLSLQPMIRNNVAALFVEPLQSEGGVHVIAKSFVEQCRDHATRCDFPLVFDEIQCGMGRTGTFLFSEQLGVTADYYLLGKSLGGGLAKISALLVSRKCYDERFDELHTSTFAEDDRSARVARTALGLFEADGSFGRRCSERGEFLSRRLRDVQEEFPEIVREVRGTGLLLGVSFDVGDQNPSATLRLLSAQDLIGPLIAAYLLSEHRVRVGWTLSDQATIRIEPSAFVSVEDCEALTEALRELAAVFAAGDAFALLRHLVGRATSGKRRCPRRAPHASRGRVAARTPASARLPAVGFVAHFIHARDLRSFDPSLRPFSDAELEQILDLLYPFIEPTVTHRIPVRSARGASVELQVIGFIVDSRIIADAARSGDLSGLLKKVEDAVGVAIANGCTAVGLGGYSSIITRNCQSILTDRIALTSGNALTVGMGVEALRRGAEQAGIALGDSTLAVVGAAGNICATYAELLAEEVKNLVLIGRPGSDDRLRAVADRIYAAAWEALDAGSPASGGVAAAIAGSTAAHVLHAKPVAQPGAWLRSALARELGPAAPVRISTNLRDVAPANLIVSASNEPGPILFPELLGRGPIVICDIAVPEDVHPTMSMRGDVHVIQGGITLVAGNETFEIGGVPLEPGVSFACMAETLVLGLSGIGRHYSFGRITPDQVKEITALARMHGITLARAKVEASY